MELISCFCFPVAILLSRFLRVKKSNNRSWFFDRMWIWLYYGSERSRWFILRYPHQLRCIILLLPLVLILYFFLLKNINFMVLNLLLFCFLGIRPSSINEDVKESAGFAIKEYNKSVYVNIKKKKSYFSPLFLTLMVNLNDI